MGAFTLGKLSTFGILVAEAAVSGLVSAGFIYAFAVHLAFSDVLSKVAAVIAMVTEILTALFCFASSHAVRLAAESNGFGLFSMFGMVATAAEITYFCLLCSTTRRGFAAACGGTTTDCRHAHLLITFAVLIWVNILFRSYALLVLWDYELKTKFLASNTAKTAQPGGPTSTASSKASSLPKFSFTRRHLRTASGTLKNNHPSPGMSLSSVREDEEQKLYSTAAAPARSSGYSRPGAAKDYELSEEDSEDEVDFLDREGDGGAPKGKDGQEGLLNDY